MWWSLFSVQRVNILWWSQFSLRRVNLCLKPYKVDLCTPLIFWCTYVKIVLASFVFVVSCCEICSERFHFITKTRPFKYIENFITKNCIFFKKKNSDNVHISVQNIDCGYSLDRGGSNEYPQSMFLSRNKKTNVYPCKPQFYYIKVGFKGDKLYRYVFVMFSFDL